MNWTNFPGGTRRGGELADNLIWSQNYMFYKTIELEQNQIKIYHELNLN